MTEATDHGHVCPSDMVTFAYDETFNSPAGVLYKSIFPWGDKTWLGDDPIVVDNDEHMLVLALLQNVGFALVICGSGLFWTRTWRLVSVFNGD